MGELGKQEHVRNAIEQGGALLDAVSAAARDGK
jgi:hypothetical protein